MTTLSRALDACRSAGVDPADVAQDGLLARRLCLGRKSIEALRLHLGLVLVVGHALNAPGRDSAGNRPDRAREVSKPMGGVAPLPPDAGTAGPQGPLIISRHPGAVAWLAAQGITGEVVAHATPQQVRGRDVIGVLPLALAAEAHSVSSIDLPGLAPEQRGRDLSPDEMNAAGATLRRYRVIAI